MNERASVCVFECERRMPTEANGEQRDNTKMPVDMCAHKYRANFDIIILRKRKVMLFTLTHTMQCTIS